MIPPGQFKPLHTRRFLLRPVKDDDLTGLYELESDPEVHRYLGNQPMQRLEETQGIIDYIQGQYRKHGIGRLAVIDKKTGDFVGWSGLKYEQMVRPNRPYYDLGYRLKRDYWGKGVATETSVELLRYGFQDLNLPEICAGAHVENGASNRVLQKLGFELIEEFVYDGDPHNWYEMTVEDWENIQSK